MRAFDIPVYGPSKNVPQDDAERTVNMYPEKVTDSTYTLKRRAGHLVTGRAGFAGGGRGQIDVGGRHFAIRGFTFCEMVDGVSVTRGTLVSNDGICGEAACLPPDGSGQILIVGPGEQEGYVFELATNTFTALTEADHGFVGGAGQCVFFGGRAWAIKKGTGQFQCSEPYNFLSWPGDAFGTAEFDSDELQALDTDGNYLLLLGKYTGEVWNKQDTLPLPVGPTTSTFRIGILAPQAHCCFEDDFYWFGGNAEGKGVVYRLRIGGQPEMVSDYSINRNIAPLENQSDAFMYAYQSLGHKFLFLTFVQGNRTFVFDMTENLWHEESVRLTPAGNFSAMPWQSVVFHDGKLVGLSRINGDIAEIRDDLFTDNGNPIILDRILPVFPNEGSWRSFYQSVELFTEMGNTPAPTATTYENVVTGTELASDPVIYNEQARYLHVGYYVGTETLVLFAFSSDAARQSYLQGQEAVDGFMGVALGTIGQAGTITIQNGASQNLVRFDIPALTEDQLPYSFDILKQITQEDNNPSVMLRVSRDRGKTYGTEMWRKLSGNGSYVCRPRWTGLGSAFGLVLWIRFVANQQVSFRGIRIYAEGGG